MKNDRRGGASERRRLSTTRNADARVGAGWGAIVLCALVSLVPATSIALQGDCAQPSSTGNAPSAGDCLFILKTAVGAAVCTPACVCAPKGTLPTSASDALLCLRRAVGQSVTLACPCPAGTSTGDDFDDNEKDPAKWGADEVSGNGMLEEAQQRLEYSCSSGTITDRDVRPWVLESLPYDSSWDVQLDLVNLTTTVEPQEGNGFGIEIRSSQSSASNIDVELYVSAGGVYPTHGFRAAISTDGTTLAAADTGSVRVLYGAVRVRFDGTTGVVHVFYDTDYRGGYQWTEYGSFGTAGVGGTTGNVDWNMTTSDTLGVVLYGYSAGMSVPSAQVWADNFIITRTDNQ